MPNYFHNYLTKHFNTFIQLFISIYCYHKCTLLNNSSAVMIMILIFKTSRLVLMSVIWETAITFLPKLWLTQFPTKTLTSSSFPLKCQRICIRKGWSNPMLLKRAGEEILLLLSLLIITIILYIEEANKINFKTSCFRRIIPSIK